MTVLDVYLNDRKLCRAGVGRDGVLDAIVSWVKLTGEAAATARRLKRPLEETRLHVGGLRDDTHLTWSRRNLQPGDRVAVVLGRGKSADEPKARRRRDPRREEQLEHQYYLRLKEKFEPQPHRTPGQSVASEQTRFLNVDLDMWSSSPLDALVKAFGKRVTVLYAGREGRRHSAHLELAIQSNNPDRLIRRFVQQVRRLPPTARRLWNQARAREFNVGVQAGRQPHGFELRLAPRTLSAVAHVNAHVGFTVYAAAPEDAKPL